MVEINFSESRELFDAIDATIASEEFSGLSRDEKLSALRDISQGSVYNSYALTCSHPVPSCD